MEAVLRSADSIAVEVADSTHVSAARQAVARITQALDFDETHAGQAAIVVTEAVTNMLKHGGGGSFIARPLSVDGAIGIEMLAIDKGPGMEDFEACAVDGHSTAGTRGNGLGAMRRQSDEFEVYTRRGEGTILRALIWRGAKPAGDCHYVLGALVVPKPGESVCGDAWGAEFSEEGATFLLADGLGHGPDARRAAASAVDALHSHPREAAVRIVDRAHMKLRPTRGAAVAVMRHEAASGELAFAGVGNISACVIDADSRRAMVSHNGIVGHNMHKSTEYRYPWAPGGLLVAHTDGIDTRWDLAQFPGLTDCHPSVIAAMLYREHARGRDDAGIVVARLRH
jgi:anti-sigma regulatory factor (Ser/Thr protein kinase)